MRFVDAGLKKIYNKLEERNDGVKNTFIPIKYVGNYLGQDSFELTKPQPPVPFRNNVVGNF
jgi:hypothetical protein